MIRTIEDLKTALRRFADERDWEQFHSPKNLAMALGVEVAELAEHFQWMTQQESLHLTDDKKEAVRHELADILIYLVRLADRLEIDLLAAAESKMIINDKKYPAESCRGCSERPKTEGN